MTPKCRVPSSSKSAEPLNVGLPSHVLVETKVVLTGAKSEDEHRNKYTAQSTSADLVQSRMGWAK
jgi:hypothetical protein